MQLQTATKLLRTHTGTQKYVISVVPSEANTKHWWHTGHESNHCETSIVCCGKETSQGKA